MNMDNILGTIHYIVHGNSPMEMAVDDSQFDSHLGDGSDGALRKATQS